MLSIRKIRRKIRSVNNIKKITRAMEMVSAAKLKKVQARLYAIRPFMTKLQTILDNTLTSLPQTALTHPFLRSIDVSNRRTIGLIVVASNKGLCGGYNTNLLKTATRFIQENSQTAIIKIMALGKKATDFFLKHGFNVILSYSQVPPDINSQLARQLLQPFITGYEKGELLEIWLVYTEFINPMVYKPKVKRLVPILETKAPENERTENLKDSYSVSSSFSHPVFPYGYLFEPTPKIILELLLPRYIDYTFYHLLLESLASEHSARMMAMRNATDNAEEVIENLTLSYNKARQASITKELLDIVSGAEAMK